ncbi:ATP phosphoribosyltransferase regulatory subunit [Oceanicola sp. 502str15]|uniref:ATP phosphoribosyltransferase regulatory subunit n=1 Tax=Oceanicola sp. 502str15 TaxID=2696061 RepID=UPI002094F336|nr:ATP phosphoribosyltransferase regulatory subunit [Oceanicola sp. 502str15]MCO6381177.1 ATP phosphoribosyltransferase regulatory subunit [Oceanicola sp. 502str15]
MLKDVPREEVARLIGLFEAAGALRVGADVLQPADTLLDLYGEEIRARAYVTHDPLRGELMLRPDFTVPVVQAHMAQGQEPARYCYAGTVFRMQEHDSGRPSEFEQVGFELFDRGDRARADAEIFALMSQCLAGRGLRAAIGDIGVLSAAVAGLSTSEKRRAALMRHLWRPRRFRALLDRYGGRAEVPPSRAALLARLAGEPAEKVLAGAGPDIGLRRAEEVLARVAALQADAQEPPIPEAELGLLDDLLGVRAAPVDALEHLRDLAVDMPALTPALDTFAARLDALADAGVDLSALEFEGSFGRTLLEYYDGFVFGFFAPQRPDLPAVASGGRYDALCRVLGQGREIPAVGAVIRPALLSEIGEAG